LVVALIILIFVSISFVTNIWRSLIPDVQASFNLSLALVGFIPTFLFLAYGVSIPVGMLAICVTIGYLIFIALWAKPLINNATIGSKKKAAEAA
jgi:fucose permease